MNKTLALLLTVAFLAGCGGDSTTAFKGKTEDRSFIQDGINYLKESDVPRAIHSFDMAIKQDPTNPDNFITLGQVYLRLKNYTSAIDSFTAAIKVDPQNGEAYYLLAMSRALDGRRAEAVEAAQQSVEIFMQERNEEKFKQSVILLRGLMEDMPDTESKS